MAFIYHYFPRRFSLDTRRQAHGNIFLNLIRQLRYQLATIKLQSNKFSFRSFLAYHMETVAATASEKKAVDVENFSSFHFFTHTREKPQTHSRRLPMWKIFFIHDNDGDDDDDTSFFLYVNVNEGNEYSYIFLRCNVKILRKCIERGSLFSGDHHTDRNCLMKSA